MAIAIFRHLKLYVAFPSRYKPVVLNFNPRQYCLIDSRTTVNEENQEIDVTKVSFTRLKRRKGLLINEDEHWHFRGRHFEILKNIRRNGDLLRSSIQVIPPAFPTIWTQTGNDQEIFDQFEDEIATRVAVERHLHKHLPNPYDYNILEMDLSVKGRPDRHVYNSFYLRTPEMVEIAAKTDRSGDSKQWAELFLS